MRQETSEPSTKLTISGEKEGAGENMGEEKVIKKLQEVKQESFRRKKKWKKI